MNRQSREILKVSFFGHPLILSKFRRAVEDLKVGDGEKAGTTIGPIINTRWIPSPPHSFHNHHPLIINMLINDRQLERVERIVNESVAAGAKVEVGQLQPWRFL